MTRTTTKSRPGPPAQAKPKAPPPAASKTTQEAETDQLHGAARPSLGVVREWADALVIAFLLAMFIRTFVVELFKIPSGSMTPTLVGTSVNAYGAADEMVMECDVNGDGRKDLVLERTGRYPRGYHVFYRGENGKFVANEQVDSLTLPPEARRTARARNDRIVVNKFIYWLRQPRRGEIVVFRVPESIYEPDKPIYIKRVVGLPGDTVAIRHPHLYVNGKMLDQPEVFQRIEYINRFGATSADSANRPGYIQWHTEREGFREMDTFDSAHIPEAHYFVLGDNSKSSRDSRYWGAFRENHLKGKAVLRYWPLDTIGFLE